jgi:hypothetical protein
MNRLGGVLAASIKWNKINNNSHGADIHYYLYIYIIKFRIG